MDHLRTTQYLATTKTSLILPTWDEIRTKQEDHDRRVLPGLINKHDINATRGHLLDNASDDRKEGLEHLKSILEEAGVPQLFWVVFRATRRNRTYGDVVREMIAEWEVAEEEEEKEQEDDREAGGREIEIGAGSKRKR